MHIGDPLRMTVDKLVKGLPLQTTVGDQSRDLVTVSSYLPVRSKPRLRISEVWIRWYHRHYKLCNIYFNTLSDNFLLIWFYSSMFLWYRNILIIKKKNKEHAGNLLEFLQRQLHFITYLLFQIEVANIYFSHPICIAWKELIT